MPRLDRQPSSPKLGRFFVLLSVFAAFLIIFLSVGLNRTGQKNPAGSSAPTKTVFIASGHPEWAPIMYKYGDTIKGVGPDLVKKIFTDLNLPLEIKYMGTWDQVLEKAKTGEVDVLVGAYQTKERLEYLGYSSTPFAEDPVSLFVAKNKKFVYNDWDSLLDKRGVAMIGDSYGQEFDDFIKTKSLNLKRASSSKEAFDLVINGKADYFIYSRYAGQKALASSLPLSSKISVVPQDVTTEDFYLAISQKSPYFKYLAQVSKDLYEQKKSAYVNYLINKYSAMFFGNQIIQTSNTSKTKTKTNPNAKAVE